MDELIGETFGRRLQDLGFEQMDRRSWVRSDKLPIRERVGIESLKGYSFVPVWSIAVSFVPHITRAGKIGWHRTAKQFRSDLLVDPIDAPKLLRADRLRVQGMHSRRDVHRDLDRSARLSTKLAERWFSRITDVRSLVSLFEEAERQPVVRFGFDNFPSSRLAFAFVLAHVGDRMRAQTQLDQWCQLHLPSPVLQAELQELLDETAR